jgi:Tfp pilus assembly protein PilN
MRAVNLIPVEQRSGQPVGAGRSQGGAYAVLVLIGGLALMAFLYGQSEHQVTSRRAQATSLAAQAQQAQAEAERLAPYTSFIAQREQRVQAVNALVDSRFDWAHALHEFGRVLPAQTSISSLSGSVGGASSTGTKASAGAAPTFTLAGCATSQPEVAVTLERLQLIDGVKEVTLQGSTSGSASASSSAGASASGSGGCSGRDASFSATVVFDALPSSSAVAAAAKSVSDSTGAGSASGASTSTAGSAK